MKAKIDFRPVGDVFECQGRKLEVVEASGASCLSCAFKYRRFCLCSSENLWFVSGSCFASSRPDGKFVVFRAVCP